MTTDCERVESTEIAASTEPNGGKVAEQQQQLVSLLKKSTIKKSNKNNVRSLFAKSRCSSTLENQQDLQTTKNVINEHTLNQNQSQMSGENSNKTHIMAPATTTTINISSSASFNSPLDKTSATSEPYDTQQGNITSKSKRPTTRQSQQTPKKSQKPRRRVATVAQRRAANIRERRRMFNLNAAFDRLRKKVPSFAYEKRLSRIETLKLAIMYIKFMDDLVHDDEYAEKYKQLTANSSLGSSSTSFLTSGQYLSLYRGPCIGANQQQAYPHQSRSNEREDIKRSEVKHDNSKYIGPKMETKSDSSINNSTVGPITVNQYEHRQTNCLDGRCNGQYRAGTTPNAVSSPLFTCCSSPSSSSAITCHSSSSSSSSSASSANSMSTNNGDLSPNSTSPIQTFNSSPMLRHNLPSTNQSSSDHSHHLSSLNNVYYSKTQPISAAYQDVCYDTTGMMQSITPSYDIKQVNDDHKVAFYNQNYHQNSMKNHNSYTPTNYMSSREPILDSYRGNNNDLQCNFSSSQINQTPTDSHYKFDLNHQSNQTICHQDQQEHQLATGSPALALNGQSICGGSGNYSLHSLQAR